MLDISTRIANLPPSKRKLLELALGNRDESLPSNAISRRSTAGEIPLSFAQQRLWFLDQLEPNHAAYHLAGAIRIEGPLQVAILEKAFNAVVKRHEVLRTTFRSGTDEPVQIIAPELVLNFPLLDLQNVPESDRETEVSRLATEWAQRGFVLSEGPLLRAQLLRLSEEEHLLLLTLHHIIADGWSVGILIRELSSFYQGEELEELAIQYGDYAVWQRAWLQGEKLAEELGYWREQLAGAPAVLALPTDHVRPAVQSFRGGRERLELPSELLKQLQQLSQEQGTTLFMTLLGAFQVLLWRLSGQRDVVVGTPIANRQRRELEGLIGFFANTLVLRTQVDGSESFRELLGRVKETCLGAYAHQDVPFEKLVEELQPERSLSHSPLFQVMFIMQNAAQEDWRLGAEGLRFAVQGLSTAAAKFDLTLTLSEGGAGLQGWLEYNSDLFAASTIARFGQHYECLLGSIVAEPGRAVGELEVLRPAERAQLLREWNETSREYPLEKCIQQLIEEQVEQRAAAVAVRYEGEAVSYEEMNRRANRLGHYLQELGVGPEVVVGICVERSVEMVVGLLGILKAGGAYLPLDPAYPKERLDFMLADSGAEVLVTMREVGERFASFSGRQVLLDDEALVQQSELNLECSSSPENLCYVIYTSGSTGQPKGVMINHRSVINLLCDIQSRLSLSERDTMLAVTTISFDIAGLELYLPLLVGAAVHVASRVDLSDGEALSRLILNSEATVMQATPATWRMLEEAGWQAPQSFKVLCGGEALGLDLALSLSGKGIEVWNVYGPTETTIWSTSARVDQFTDRVVIGRPLANTEVYLLDEQLNPVPVGVPGELFIGGHGLARGYFKRADLAAEKFIPHPYSLTAGERLYRTGDLARYLPNGEIECLGRLDRQVKLRGFRIELEEIETVLKSHPQVVDGAVVLNDARNGEKRLVAYVVTSAPSDELRRYMAERLPEYMVPGVIEELDALPLTANGKVDRARLPEPVVVRREAEQEYQAPRSPLESGLVEIWEQLLRVERVGIRDNFFALGGHSLLATRLMSRVRETFGTQLPLRRLFEHPTVGELAEELERAEGSEQGLPAIVKVGREESLPLSFAQQRLWFLDQLEPGSTAYNMPGAIRISGALDVSALERSLAAVVRRHESLRSRFEEREGQPRQVIDADVKIELRAQDLAQLDEAERAEKVQQMVAEEAQRGFVLSEGPLLRAQLLRLSEEEHLLLLTLHHIIADGWSVGILIRELSSFYQGEELEELAIQYGDYAVWQRAWLQGEKLAEELGYWREQLAGAPAVLGLPTDHVRPAVQSFRGGRERLELPSELMRELQQLSQEQGATLFMTLLGAFQVLLWRLSGQRDVVVGTPIANRQRRELEGLIGFFANTLVLRTQVDGSESFRELLGRVKETCLGAYAHQDVPFEKLVEELQPERSLSHSPLFQVMFIMQNAAQEDWRLGAEGLRFAVQGLSTAAAKFDLTLTLSEGGAGLQGWLEYNSDLFAASTIARFGQHYECLLASIVAEPNRAVGELEVLRPAERQQLLREWNATGREYPAEKCIQQLIEEQVEQHAAAVAVRYEGETVSYQELNRRANRLAHYLKGLGVGPEVVVGICVERSVEMMVGLLGILKAGGAYLPLDPAYPKERLDFMLADSGAEVLVTMREVGERFANFSGRQVLLDDEALVQQSELNLECSSSPENLCYVIYTSGSTGQPKGVMIAHRNLANFCAAIDDVLGTEPGVWLALTSMSFDISVLELLWTLSRGYEVVIAGEQRASTVPLQVDRTVIDREIEFSLFYFASDGEVSAEDRYELLLEGAKFADQNGFAAIWTPERHFHEFGGSYPNPSVTSAALATITERVHLRAGSVVSPLHNPIRIAEEWSMVDNFSKGRIGISFASGWHADDFVFAPDSYKTRHKIMYQQIEIVRRLWQGGTHRVRGGAGNEIEVKLRPRPVQPELPVWVTAAGSPDTFRSAGEIGAGLLTHLLGQSVEDVGRNIAIYRNAWQEAGHQGTGHVTLMLHAFVGEDLDVVREKVRAPLTNYLKSSLSLIKNLAQSFGRNLDEEVLSEDDWNDLLAKAFDRYFETSGLLGTPAKCIQVINRLKEIEVDEVACLIDFGVDTNSAMASLHHLNEVRKLSNRKRDIASIDYSVPALIERNKPTHVQCTPSLASILVTDSLAFSALSGLDTLLLGGEPLPHNLALSLFNCSPTSSIFNMYGPTETTIWSTTHQLSPSASSVPIGRPLANTQIYILNGQLAPAPIGVAGELYIGGDGVVRGYMQRPDQTSERFIPDQFSNRPGARLYRTGDLARYLPDGSIEYIGRVDQQIKLRGFRVELGEIEAVLGNHPALSDAVVVVRQSPDVAGDSRLVAYVVVASGNSVTTAQLREHLRERLPEYMVPGVIEELEALPLTANGKVDRARLPEPSAMRREAGQEYQAPRSPLESGLVEIWEQLLRVERVGIRDNFFALGGHSLLATRLMSRVRETFGTQLPLRRLFEHPTVAELAEELERAEGSEQGLPAIVKVGREESLPLSFAQQRLWFLDQLEPGSTAYNMPGAIRISGALDVSALERSLAAVVRRHESLRSRFEEREGQPRQVIEAAVKIELRALDLTELDEAERAEKVQQLVAEEAQRGFVLSAGPLLRAQLLRLSEEEHLLLLTLHHIIADGWSVGILIRELSSFYQREVSGAGEELEELGIQYGDYAVWQRAWLQGEKLAEELGYWREQLAGAPAVLGLPTDHVRPAVQSFRGGRERLELPAELLKQLQQLSQEQGATLFMTLLGAFQVLLWRLSGQRDVVVGTPIANRQRRELEGLIGFFANTLVLRTQVDGSESFRELLGRVKETCLGAYAHQDVPFEKLVEELQPERSLSHSPLFQVAFVLQNEPTQKLEIPGLVFDYMPQEDQRAKFDLILTMTETPQGLKATLEYNADLFESSTARRMLSGFETLVTGLVAHSQSPVSDLPLLTDSDQHQLVTRWNPSPIESDFEAPVFRSFEEQVERTPDAIAVICGAEHLSYADLNNHANRLAVYLNKAGVRPEVPVGLYSKPSLQRVVGLLGILKAGGVCVPFDGTTDYQRLDTSCPVIVTHEALTASLAMHHARIVSIDSLLDGVHSQNEENPNNTISPENLAYRIEFGASRIEVEHRALTRAIGDRQGSYFISSEDVVLHLAAGDQDTAIHEILWPLLHGGRLVIAYANEAQDRTGLLRLMSTERVSVVHLAPPALETFLELNDGELEVLDSLSCVLCSDETLTALMRHELRQRVGAKLHLLQSCPGIAAKLAANQEDSESGSTRLYVLDQTAQLVPLGVNGEIYVGGPALARGYAEDAAETATRFIPDSFSGIAGERLWRTAESGRRLNDGRLERHGSTERRAWIQGYLIDLEEVEIALLQAPAVNECAVLARVSDDARVQLVAYVVTTGFFLPERLNSFLQDKLRAHMIPSAYVPVTTIPLTEEGEIDEQELMQLPVLDSSVLMAWEKHLSSLPGVERVAVVIQEADETTTQLDLTELVPEQSSPARAIQVSRKESVSSVAETQKPAISHGEPLNEDNLAATLIEALQRAAQDSPGDSIVYYQRDGSEILQSYSRLLEEAERILGSLRGLGLEPHDKVIFQLDLNQDFIPAFWACILGGFVPVPISIAPIYEESNSTVSKLINSWKMLEQPLVLASREIGIALNSLANDLGLHDFAVAVIDDLRTGSPAKDWYAAKPDDVALILLTSGSTGMPKGVVQTHRKIVGRSVATAQMNNFTSADVSLNWFPLDHVGGLLMFHVRDVCVGARQIQVPTHAILSDPLKWLDLIERYRVTVTWAPNFAYALVNDRHPERGTRHWDLSSLRFILNGGEAVVARTARRFLELLAPYGLPATAMHPAWGMSETCSGVTYSDRFTTESTSDDDSFVEVGGPVPGISIRITDAQDQPVVEETIGRLQVKGISVLSEYYNNPEINQQSFTKDGWFITGDIGYLKDGRLTITGREKDVIIVNGANYYSHEIESVVEEIEGVEVSFTAACSISQPGSDTDRLAIFFNTSSVDWQERLALINEIRQRVVRSIGVKAEFVIPVEKDQIPKTAIGKIQRSLLVEQFNEGAFDLVLKQVELQSGKGRTLPDWFFKKTWRRRFARTLPRKTAGSILILCDKAGLGQQVRVELARLKQASVMVDAGEEFIRRGADSYCIDVSNPAHYGQLIQSLAADQVQVTEILHLWTYEEYQGEATSQDELDKSQDHGLYSLLYLVQALDPEIQDEEKRIHVVVASSHAQALSATDTLAYEKSTMFGLLKTLPLERQWLSCCHVDLPLDLPTVNAARLLPEIAGGTTDDEVAYRDGRRWVSQLEKVNLRRQPLQDLPFKSRGLYLLTGGLGGIGVEIARYLLKHHDARLILVGRTSLDEALPRLEAYEELKRLSGDVVYESIDINDLVQLQRVVSETEGRWNCELNGVIHLAGTLGEQLIEQATRESVDATLGAKVYGTWALHELLKPRRKDVLFISFSSVNSFFGGVTVGAYAAANSFLETFMQYRRNQGWSNSYCYSWSLWDETGMTRGYLLKDLSRARGYYAISTEQGVKSWLAGLHRREPQLLIGLDGGNRNIRPHIADTRCVVQKVTAYFTSRDAEQSLVQLAEGCVHDRFQHPVDCEFVQLDELPLKESGEIDLDKLSGLGAGDFRALNDDDEPVSDTEVELCRIWQELLDVQRVGRHDNFFQLGGHSLLSMQLISRLRDTFHIELPLRTLFESSTVAGLAEQIDTILWATEDRHEPLAAIGSQHEEGIL